ncbi:XRE family transcriptional regulator [Paraburkholderia sp. USG1]|uniref:helix-turn-helix domain-containing protein n=1 Tax=Paraburkholderia sp. USG1 TaxID=2952268 RepID=UPI0028618522|nr:XRE family transcriptional regulator [Paraburkholderia sp. USG1]MDR8400837.1 XRE family transcriptional regulator [Paraburkholderia sp. USG1]
MAIELKVRPEVLGPRLKGARSLAKLTQEQVAQRLRIARTTVVAIESGKRGVSSSELRAFAELYAMPESELLADGTPSLDMELKFRAHSSSDDVDSAAAHLLLNKLAAASVELEAMLDRRMLQPDLPVVTISRSMPVEQQAEDVALSIRQRLGIGFGPIPDLIALVELDMGLRVFERGLPSKVSGAFAYDEAIGGFIVVNALHPASRRRLTIAHELCHALLRRAGIVVHMTEGDFSDREEKFCDAFARALLMPAMTVRKKAAELRDAAGQFSVRQLLAMAVYFHTSIEAMTRRLEGLNLLPKGTFESLKAKGLGTQHLEEVRRELDEPEAVGRFSPRTLLLAAEAFEKGLLSEQQIARKLQLDLGSVREVLGHMAPDGEGEELELAI